MSKKVFKKIMQRNGVKAIPHRRLKDGTILYNIYGSTYLKRV